jgi:hypothetical protein
MQDKIKAYIKRKNGDEQIILYECNLQVLKGKGEGGSRCGP